MTRKGLAVTPLPRHCEERSDVAIQLLSQSTHWIAALRSQ